MTDNHDHSIGAADNAALVAEIEHFRASGALGASGRLPDLFNYLAARIDQPTPPSETEIAIDVFKKTDAEDLQDDPVARVYVHRLRKRLDDFYLRDTRADAPRLTIPKGTYKLVLEHPETKPEKPESNSTPITNEPAQPNKLFFVSIALAAIGCIALLFSLFQTKPSEPHQLSSPIWDPITTSDRPLTVVVGDYYIFGEYDDGLFLKRIVRDFAVNSEDDLLQKQLSEPTRFARARDIALEYLPSSTATALTRLAPVFANKQAQDQSVQILLASDLTPADWKDSDILYVGLFSGLGQLRGPVFSESRFKIGTTFDEIVDTETRRTYTSKAFQNAASDAIYRDYALLSSFTGPTGNHIITIAGARDAALSGLIDNLTTPSNEPAPKSDHESFETLYEISGQQRATFNAKPLVTTSLDADTIWNSENILSLEFPSE